MPRAPLMAALVFGALSWLHHSEVTDGGRRSPSPDPPAWVVKADEATVASGQ
jgi:hypothetical protein